MESNRKIRETDGIVLGRSFDSVYLSCSYYYCDFAVGSVNLVSLYVEYKNTISLSLNFCIFLETI